jgi:NitT/TauT family transport system permease protein
MTTTHDSAVLDRSSAVPPAERTRRSGGSKHAFIKALPWLTFAVVLGLWQLGASRGSLDKDFFSSPGAVWSAAVAAVQTDLFWNDVWVSVREMFGGYGLAVLVAIPVGLLAGLHKRVQYMVDPWLNAFNALPRIALIPLIVLWFGLGLESKVVIAFVGAAVSIAINTFDGARAVSQDFLDVAYSYGAPWRKRMVSVVIPAVTPFALVGLRLGIGRAVAGVMVGEYFTSDAGLGNYIFRAGQTLQTDKLLVGAISITLIALACFKVLALVERRVHRWRPAVGSASQ